MIHQIQEDFARKRVTLRGCAELAFGDREVFNPYRAMVPSFFHTGSGVHNWAAGVPWWLVWQRALWGLVCPCWACLNN